MLSINIQDLPQKVYSAAPKQVQLDKHLTHGLTVPLTDGGAEKDGPDIYETAVDLYGFVQKRLDSYKRFSISQEELESTIGQELEQYCYTAAEELRSDDDDNCVGCPCLVTPAVWSVAGELIQDASHQLGRRYSKRLSVALALHIQQFIGRMKAGKIIYNPNLPSIKTQYPAELDVIHAAIPSITQQLDVSLPEDEAGFLAMFLTQQIEAKACARVGLVVVSHGRGIASGMAEVANRLFSSNHARALDVPLSWPLTDVLDHLCQIVSDSDQGNGVLILGDIDSLIFMEADIQERSGVRCRIVPGVSTSLVLEASKLVLIGDAALDHIADIIADNYQDYANFICKAMLKRDVSPNEEVTTRPMDSGVQKAILTVCHSGIGTAARVREILIDNLPITKHMDVIPVGMLEEVGTIAARLGDRLRLVIGSVNPGLENVPYVEMSKVLTNQGLNEIDLILQGWNDRKMPPPLSEGDWSREEIISLINSQIQRFAPGLDADQVIQQCGYVLRGIETRICSRQLSAADAGLSPYDLYVRPPGRWRHSSPFGSDRTD